MNILFTGGSSFTGMWFAEELVKAGHAVTLAFRRDLQAYAGVRRQRVERLLALCPAWFNMSFGDAAFVQAIEAGKGWDLYCHHAADVADYRSPGFDPAAALVNNTRHIRAVLDALKTAGCGHVLLTGSVFEQREGRGSGGLRAVSPYGLSKGLTSDTFAYYTEVAGMKLGKFVIPNPFGPFEEGRFTTYLVGEWLKRQTPSVNAPEYVRDNIPVSLLAKAYAHFAGYFVQAAVPAGPACIKTNPSCYVESQGVFTERLAEAMRARLGVPCDYQLKEQLDFSEPLVRVNTEPLDWEALGWHEQGAWDSFADYILEHYAAAAAVGSKGAGEI